MFDQTAMDGCGGATGTGQGEYPGHSGCEIVGVFAHAPMDDCGGAADTDQGRYHGCADCETGEFITGTELAVLWSDGVYLVGSFTSGCP